MQFLDFACTFTPPHPTSEDPTLGSPGLNWAHAFMQLAFVCGEHKLLENSHTLGVHRGCSYTLPWIPNIHFLPTHAPCVFMVTHGHQPVANNWKLFTETTVARRCAGITKQGCVCLQHIKPNSVSVCSKIRVYLQGVKQGELTAHAQKTWTPWWLLGKGV